MPESEEDKPEKHKEEKSSSPARQQAEDATAEENFSNLLWPLPSPTSSASDLDGPSDVVVACRVIAERIRRGRDESPVGRIQRWWRRFLLETRTAKTVTAAMPAFKKTQQLLHSVHHHRGCMTMAESLFALDNQDNQRAITAVLAALPRDEDLLFMPWSVTRSTSSVLNSIIVAYHEPEVLANYIHLSNKRHLESKDLECVARDPGRDLKEPASTVFRNASRLMLASIMAVATSLEPVVKGEKGARKTLAVRMGFLRFSRRYFATSLMTWIGQDLERAAARVVHSYARVFAMRLYAEDRNDRRIADVLQEQHGHYRRDLGQLVGDENASHRLEEVEVAIPASMREGSSPAFNPPSAESSERDISSGAAAGKGGEEQKSIGVFSGGGGQGTRTPVTSTSAAESGASRLEGYLLPEGHLGRLLGNERLAHEILVNPEFQIPEVEEENSREGGSTSSSPEEELTRRLENTMRRIFWDRFTQSLLPPPPPRPNQSPSGGSEGGVGRKGEGEMKGEIGGEELRVGSQVHARYGSDRGSYYSATVISVTRERSGGGSGGDGGDGDREGVFVDVRYNEDGVVERGVSAVRRLKKRRDPPDFGPLLSLLREVREELVSLTPNNAVVVGEVEAELGQERLQEMLESKNLDARQVQGLLSFIFGRILDLQAPARSESARTWLRGFYSELEAAISSEDAFAIVPLLPRAFEFAFSRIEEIKRDVANAHIRMIAPYLARHGVDFERAKFEARLASGAVKLDLTKAWISKAVEGYIGREALKGGTEDDEERARRAAGLRNGREEFHRNMLQEAFIGLLRSEIRLDRPDAKLPETLAADGARLAAARDDVDRVALTATMLLLLRQVLARLGIACPTSNISTLQERLGVLLKQDGVNMAQIVEECVETANHVAASISATGSQGADSPKEQARHASALPPGEEQRLRSLLMSSPNPSHEVFRVLFGRVLSVLKAIVSGEDADKACGRHGLQAFVGELRPVGVRLRRLFSHSLKVFAGHYRPLVSNAAREFHTNA